MKIKPQGRVFGRQRLWLLFLRILPGGEERGRVSGEESGKRGSHGAEPVVVTVCIR